MKQKIILATTSPRRHELARNMGLEFEIIPSRYEEEITAEKPEKLVMKLAYGKASEVAKRVKEGIVIGVDTIVVFKGKKLGKPKNKKDAFKTLKSFSGRKQAVYSGVAMINAKTGKTVQDCEVSTVEFRKMKDSEIQKYIETGEPMDKAGSYGMQGLAGIFIKKINGCYFNIVGFPVYNIYKNLQKMGVNVFEYDRWKGKITTHKHNLRI